MKDKSLNKVAVLIPSLDPETALIQFTEELIRVGFQTIIVVNDGSKKEKQSIFEELEKQGVVVLHHAVNQGKGRALKTGFHYFLNHYADMEKCGVVTADADNQHAVEDIVKVANRLVQEQNLVLGTRDFSEKQVPAKSRSGNQLTTLVFKLLYGKKIQDTQTGLRGIPYSFVKKCLQLEGERFEFETTMLIAAIKEGISFTEEPIQTIYIDSNRETHFLAVRDSLKIYGVIFQCFLKYSCSALLSFAIDIGLFAFLTKLIFKNLNVEWALLGGTLIARACSSMFNYTVNRNITFESHGKVRNTIVKYYILCVVQAIFSWLLVTFSFSKLQWDTTFLKMVVDTLLFFISFQIQRVWVFQEEQK